MSEAATVAQRRVLQLRAVGGQLNPWDLDATGLMVWGLVAHLIADWPLQNDWMANGKGWPWRWSVLGLAPAFTHALIHAVALGLVFGYWPGMALGAAHLLIDTRVPVAWWSRFVRQTQPMPAVWAFRHGYEGHVAELRTAPRQHLSDHAEGESGSRESQGVVVDVGMEVRFWTDQVFHIACLAVAALVLA